MKQTTISSAEFQRAKESAIQNQLLRKEVNFSELSLSSPTHINYAGVNIEITQKVFKKILSRLRVPTAFAQRFTSDFGEGGLSQLVQMVKTKRTSAKDYTLTLLIDPKSKKAVDVLPEGYASISNESFFNFAEEYIDKFGLQVKSAGTSELGSSSINTVSDKFILDVPGMKNELFSTGLSFSNSPDGGLQISPFLDRLVCSNGITTRSFAENFSLKTLTPDSIEKFNEHMLHLASNQFAPVGFNDFLKRAATTDASLAEMQSAMNYVLSSGKDVSYEYAQRYIPIEKSMNAYRAYGINPAEFSKPKMKNAKSGVSVWDLVGGLTNFASNDKKYRIDDHTRTNLMIGAGNLLVKNQYDTESLVRLDPFRNSNLLSDSEGSRIRGEKY
jgi:hypothetical protein